MFLAELYNPSRLIHVPRYIPYVEVFRCVHDEELAQAVHKTRCTPCRLSVIRPIVVHRAPVDLDDGPWAGIAPHGDGRSVRVVVDAASTREEHKKRVTRDDR